MAKIFLSPSEQYRNAYAYGGTNEGTQMGQVADKVKEYLERCGFEVLLQHDGTMASKVAKANRWGADAYVPIHSNAGGGSGTLLMYGGDKGHRICNVVSKYLFPVTPGRGDVIRQNRNLYEVRCPNAPTCYIETEFHDRADLAEWIINHHDELAKAICHGLCDYFGVACKLDVPEASGERKDVVDVEMRKLEKGMTGDDVRNAMLILKDRGYYRDTIYPGDKLFGDKMEAAVKAVQRDKGFGVDGVIGYQMLPWLYK